MYVAAAAAAASAAVGAYATYSQGQQQKKTAEYNAKMAEYQAQREREAAAANAAAYRKEADRRLATMRASYLASGVSDTSGTPLLTLMESAQESAREEVRIKRTGEMASWGLLNESNLQRMSGKSAASYGTLSAGSSLLSGAGRAYGIYKGL